MLRKKGAKYEVNIRKAAENEGWLISLENDHGFGNTGCSRINEENRAFYHGYKIRSRRPTDRQTDGQSENASQSNLMRTHP